MKRSIALVGLLTLLALAAIAQSSKSLQLVQTIILPDVPAGPYADHLAVDLKGHRIFATPQAQKSVQVLDLNTGKLLQVISGFENPHAVLYREDLDRIYVSDGAGALKIFSGKDYHPIQSVALSPDADAIDYDSVTKYLYIDNGGEAGGADYSLLSVIDTTTGQKVDDIRVDDASKLEALVIEQSSPRIYINVPPRNQIAVIDRNTRKVVSIWPLAHNRKNMAIALDEASHRLFVGTRDTLMHGNIVVIDTRTGKETDALPIGGWVDYLAYDARNHHLYASCGVGSVYAFEQNEHGHYRRIGQADTAVMAKTALYVPELRKLFVAVPHLGDTPAQIMVFQTE